MNRKYFYFAILLLMFPVIFFAVKDSQIITGKASPQKADIVVDIKNILRPINPVWSGLSQGGEESPPMLHSGISLIKPLAPKLIRIDHIYDYYSVVTLVNEKPVYDFSKLDETVDDIIATGALPFFSLSYMPSVFTPSGSVIDLPQNWDLWKDLVKATIEHYSGKNSRNLTGVYYEVWNEPELPQFGAFKLSGDKDYRLLYNFAAKGAKEAQNVNKFYLGGPSVGSYYSSWVTDFVTFVVQNKLRLDFYSWHRYHTNPEIFEQDGMKIRNNLKNFPAFADLPLMLTEWGMDSANSDLNNKDIAAAFTIAAVSSFENIINNSFVFEIKDGPPPAGGRWGLFTHDLASPPLTVKPRYKAFEYLSKISGDKLNLTGQGSYVRGLAAKTSTGIKVILANFDSSGKNIENVPITFTNLDSYSYDLTYEYPLQEKSGFFEITSSSGTISKSFILQPNSFLYLELNPKAPIAQFVPGKSGNDSDQALILSSTKPLIFTNPQFSLKPVGSISFDIKPMWGSDNSDFLLYEIAFSPTEDNSSSLYLKKNKNQLEFGIKTIENEALVSVPIQTWDDNWHHIDASWENTNFSLSVDNSPPIRNSIPVDIRNSTALTIYPFHAAIDNLKIVVADQQLIGRFFDGNVDK